MLKASITPPENYDTVIIGMGLTGLSCARFLARQGHGFAINDSRSEPHGLTQFVREYADIPFSLGGFDRSMIAGARQLLVSPGIPLSEPAIQEAADRGVEVIGDIELFARHADAPIIAITGANGKTTVTSLLTAMAKESGLEVQTGGNIGTPALDLLSGTRPDLYILELSSFQLETTYSLNPTVATVLNISQDHMERYHSMDDYAQAKSRVFRGTGAMVINMDDPYVTTMALPERRVIGFALRQPRGQQSFGVVETQHGLELFQGSERLLNARDLHLKGRHNISNVLASLALGSTINLPRSSMVKAAKVFSGLPHRCQWVTSNKGVDWYNDSKGTNVGATAAAVLGLARKRKIVLIAGGVAKGADFTELAGKISGHLRSLIVLGQDAPLLAKAFSGAFSGNIDIEVVSDMQEAVHTASQIAQSGDAVLLSPACASFDMFEDYTERGRVFMSSVSEVTGH